MVKHENGKMEILKKVFVLLLILDAVSLVLACIALFPMFKGIEEYGQMMMGVWAAITAIALAVMVFEILAKLLLIRSTAPSFSWASGRRGCRAVAKLLVLINFGGIIISLLAAGGEGATLLNQSRLYIAVLASAAEIVAVVLYLRTVKKLCA